MTTKKDNEEDITWKGGEARRLLREDLKSGAIPLDSSEMPSDVVYQQRTEFTKYPYEQFRDCLGYL